jgi:hypothetical protein
MAFLAFVAGIRFTPGSKKLSGALSCESTAAQEE